MSKEIMLGEWLGRKRNELELFRMWYNSKTKSGFFKRRYPADLTYVGWQRMFKQFQKEMK